MDVLITDANVGDIVEPWSWKQHPVSPMWGFKVANLGIYRGVGTAITSD